MPRRTRRDFARHSLDQLESRALLSAPGAESHHPATYNRNLSAAEIETFMSGSDEGEDRSTSTATSDADMYAAFKKPVAPIVTREKPDTKADIKRRVIDDSAWERDRTDDPAPIITSSFVPDDQAPVITAAAHGDAKAIAIVATWTDQSGDDKSTITSSTGKPAQAPVVIHSSFIGAFPSRKR